MNDLVIIVPMLGRAHRAAAIVEEFAVATECAHRVVFVCSSTDHETVEACLATEADTAELRGDPEPGDWARKINFAYRNTAEPLMLLGASDLLPHPGWDKDVLDFFERRHIGVVGTNDLGNPAVRRGRHSTHPVVRREYVDKFGTIDEKGKVLYEGYHHNFPDTECVQTAMYRGRWAFAPAAIVEHMHPHWRNARGGRKGEMDDTYVRGLSRYQEDAKLFRRRQPLWKGRRLG